MKNLIKYDKLIRDKIPQIISDNDKNYITHKALDVEYREYLLKKLVEETTEFCEEPCSAEMADILEVLDALRKAFSLTNIEKIRSEKYIKRGGFEKRIILESVWED